MARTSDRDVFLKRLAKLAGEDGGFVTNERLRQELKWEKPKYRAIHSSLRQEEQIVVKRGRGGLVALGRASWKREDPEDEGLRIIQPRRQRTQGAIG